MRKSKKGFKYPVDNSGIPHRLSCGEPTSKVSQEYSSYVVNQTVRAICA